jgi:hypothetical protein
MSNITVKQSVVNRLLNFFRLSAKTQDQQLVPAKPNPNKSNKSDPINFPSDIQKFYNYWVSQMDNYATIESRLERYKDIRFMIDNNGIIARAVQLYADETIIPDENDQIINIVSKDRNVEKYIREFFDKIGINKPKLEEAAWDLSAFADHFWINTSNYTEGITEVTPIDIKQIEDRIEFNASRANTEMRKNSYYSRLASKNNHMETLYDLIKNIKEGEDYSSYFKNYLFGFSIVDSKIVLPPWNITHFRRFSSKSEFSPFGKPMFIHSIAPFRIFKAGQNLVAMLRAAKIPKELFKVKTSSGSNIADKWEIINEARQQYYNMVSLENGIEDMGIGSAIWTDQESLQYEIVDPRISADDVADIKMLLDDLITSTGIPPDYLIQGKGSWGDSGKALLQQSKPFARQIYRNQTAIIEELVNLVKTQFVMLNMFEGADTEFEISLNFPITSDNIDRIQMKNDSLKLANEILNSLTSTLGIDSNMVPIDLVKDVFTKYSFIDASDLKYWFNTIEKNKAEIEKQNKNNNNDDNDNIEESSNKKIIERFKSLDENIFREFYFMAKKKLNFNEGCNGNRHYITSFQSDPQHKLIYQAIKEIKGKTDDSNKKKLKG